MATINDVFDRILLFSPQTYTLYKEVEESRITEFEKKHNLALPNDYKIFLRKTNGLGFMDIKIYGIYDDSTPASLGCSYKFEHDDVGNPMTKNLVPFSPDGGGNHYCFDTSKCNEESCKIIFWQHDLIYGLDNQPEIVNDSFTEWVEEVVIEWTLEDYDYNGNERK